MIAPLNVMRWGDPGASKTAVALHGITANGGAWSRPGRLLAAKGWHVIAPEMRGHGESMRLFLWLFRPSAALVRTVGNCIIVCGLHLYAIVCAQ